MKCQYKKHKLSDSEKLWLTEASKTPDFDPKVAKVLLRDVLPRDFHPNNIDYRFYAHGKLTLLGLSLIDPDNPIFEMSDTVIKTVKGLIINNPHLETVKAVDVAAASGLSEQNVTTILGHIGELGRFYSAASGVGGGYNQFTLQGEDAFDEYLHYNSLDELLERRYTWLPASAHGPSIMQSMTLSDGATSKDDRVPIKLGSAFVLMAINPNNPSLEDTYNTIKEASLEFGITAYRADEIEHQGQITEQILLEIRTAEYLVADLSYERPNVYYEIGYAHAFNKKPILYRTAGTQLHFDLSVHNVPEYKNNSELRTMLRKRWEAILGRGGSNK